MGDTKKQDTGARGRRKLKRFEGRAPHADDKPERPKRDKHVGERKE